MSGRENLEEAVKAKDRRVQLEAIRDFLAHELEGNRCKTCQASQLRAGETAALVLRLTKVLEEIASLPIDTGQKSRLDQIRAGTRLSVVPEAPTSPKSAPRQQSNRRGTGTRKNA
jgi:hypothetical protein